MSIPYSRKYAFHPDISPVLGTARDIGEEI